MENISLFKPFLSTDEKKSIDSVLNIGWLGMGKNTLTFENKIRDLLELRNRYVLTCNTGFSALHLALIALNLKQNDQVIIPSFSNVANIQTILNENLVPVFCDVDENTLCIDTKKLEKLITNKTKALMFIDYGSTLANYSEIIKIQKKYKLKVIHDAAHSFGSKMNGQFVGNFFDYTMFSFDPIKTITSIDGGALILRKKSDYLKLLKVRNMGILEDNSYTNNKRSKKRNVTERGLRYHLSNLNASIGISQINKFKIIAKKRVSACKLYNKILKENKFVKVPVINNESVPFIYVIRVEKKFKKQLVNFLKNNSIETGMHWRPLHTLEISKNLNKKNLFVTKKISNEIITLPMYPEITKKEIVYICSKINIFFKNIN